MLRKIIYIFILPLILFSCNEGENPNQIPEDLPRLDEVKESYKSILTSSENGWKAIYQPSEQSGQYTILMKFKENGFVDIESDLNGFEKSANKALYDIKGEQPPPPPSLLVTVMLLVIAVLMSKFSRPLP